jgi:excisionase family DNA binding protein
MPSPDAPSVQSDALSPSEVGRALRVSVRSVYRAVERGELRAIRLGEHGPLRIPPEAILEWARPAGPVARPDPDEEERP